jgi:hypothetical protein
VSANSDEDNFGSQKKTTDEDKTEKNVRKMFGPTGEK